jgi:large subunit ribosomal protein L10
MARPDKAAAVAELSERFTSSAGVVLTEYRGLSVKALGQLRRSLGEDATYAVSKNTLTTIAARESGVDGIEAHLVGPTAIAFIKGDPVVVAKGLRDFGRTNPLLVIKGGVLDGKVMSPDEIRRLADLESREVLLAKVAGGMKGILQQAISLVAAPLSQAARLFAALQEAAAENPTLLAAGEEVSEPSAAELAAAEEAAAEPTEPEPVAAGEDVSEPTDPDPVAAGEDVSEPTTAELAAAEEAVAEPTNEELAASAATAAPAAPPANTAEDPTPASAADDN